MVDYVPRHYITIVESQALTISGTILCVYIVRFDAFIFRQETETDSTLYTPVNYVEYNVYH